MNPTGCRRSPPLSRALLTASLAVSLAVSIAVSIAGCGDNSTDTCERRFGAPSANTGLGGADCQASCPCDGFAPPVYDEPAIAALEAAELLDPPPPLESDPYDAPGDHPGDPDAFCAVIPDAGGYRLETVASIEAAAAAGGAVTHHGACGRCSTLADLAGPVRQCGLDSTGGGEPENTACLVRELGFTPACAQIWAFNTLHTREKCLAVCFAALNDPYHTADGALNPCIQCDEDESGPVFKAVAGRTRRNSGLPSALCRPCDSVAPVIHDYPMISGAAR